MGKASKPLYSNSNRHIRVNQDGTKVSFKSYRHMSNTRKFVEQEGDGVFMGVGSE